MSQTTLKSLHAYLRLVESAAELKRKMPTASNQRSLKEGFVEIGKLVGIENGAFKEPQNIAATIGSQRFIMIRGEPSVSAHVARIFDSSKVLLTVLIDSRHYESTNATSSGPNLTQKQFAGRPPSAPSATGAQSNPDQEIALESLKPMLAGSVPLTSRLFRVLFEQMLGFASHSSDQQGSATLVNELVGSKEHGRSFLATLMFVLGAEIDRENLIAFMLEQGLFGMQTFEQLLQNREYCEAYYTFRKLGRAFMTSAVEEEKQLRDRIDRFIMQFGGKAYGARIFEADDQNKGRVDAYLAAVDLLEAMALTPWGVSFNHAVAATSSNCIQSVTTIAKHFERFDEGTETREQTNKNIGDHLVAFARQFSGDAKPA